jgi:hypothetical protein
MWFTAAGFHQRRQIIQLIIAGAGTSRPNERRPEEQDFYESVLVA